MSDIGEITQIQAFQAVHDERRQFQRMSGNGLRVMLRVPGHGAVQVVVRDISRGGVSLLTRPMAVGTPVEVELPEAGGPIPGRVARCEFGGIAIAFLESKEVMGRVDRAMQALSARRAA